MSADFSSNNLYLPIFVPPPPNAERLFPEDEVTGSANNITANKLAIPINNDFFIKIPPKITL